MIILNLGCEYEIQSIFPSAKSLTVSSTLPRSLNRCVMMMFHVSCFMFLTHVSCFMFHVSGRPTCPWTPWWPCRVCLPLPPGLPPWSAWCLLTWRPCCRLPLSSTPSLDHRDLAQPLPTPPPGTNNEHQRNTIVCVRIKFIFVDFIFGFLRLRSITNVKWRKVNVVLGGGMQANNDISPALLRLLELTYQIYICGP